MEKIRSYIKSILITPLSFESWIISFTGIMLIRILLEQFSSFELGRFNIINMPTLIHYSLFYLVVSILIMITMMVFAKLTIQEVVTISVYGSCLLLIPPIIDLISSGIGGHIMSYLFVNGGEILSRFGTFFGGHVTSGATLGIQIEIALGIIFGGCYVFITTKNIYRALGMAVSLYCISFFLFSLPSIVALFLPEQTNPAFSIYQSLGNSHIIQNNIHPEFTATKLGLVDLGFDTLMIGMYVIIGLIASMVFFFIGARKKFIAILKNSRPLKVLNYLLLFVFGASIAPNTWSFNWIDVQSFILALIAFTCAWIFSVCQNDIQDKKIDTISNQSRPLISGELSGNDMNTAAKIFLLFALLAAYASSNYVLFFTSLFIFTSYIYSNPPLRLRRFVILSSSLISLACISVTMAGFFLLSNNKTITAFPYSLALAMFVFFTIAANVRDFKDIEGDKKDGVITLSTIFGLKKSKKIIAGSLCILALLSPWYFHALFLIIPSIIISILAWYLITKENYKEGTAYNTLLVLCLLLIAGIFILK